MIPMTNKQAIEHIKNHQKIHKLNGPNAILISQALDMACEALRRIDNYDNVAEWVASDFEQSYNCSNCGYSTDYDLSNFCPNCGKQMIK